MRPSRTQLVIFGIALLGLSLQRLVLHPRFDLVQDVTHYFLFNTGVELLLFGLAFGYAYHLGRTRRAGTPITVARQYLVGGVAAVGCIWAVLFSLTNYLTFDRSVQTLAILLNMAVEFVIPFLFAGLAGVPLGAMYGRADDDEPGGEGQDDADADADSDGAGETDPEDDPFEHAVRSDL